MKINCLIIDDESAARNGLSEDVRQFDFLHVLATAENGAAALDILQGPEKVDLIFLDIEMPGMTGLQFFDHLTVKPMVIITTAYQEFALRGFEMGVIDYLLKPIAFDRLAIAVHKAKENFEMRCLSALKKPANDFLFIKCNGDFEKIQFEEILFIEAANNYIFIHTIRKKFMAYLTMKSIEARLPKDIFVRTHKSFLVAKPKIDSVHADRIIIKDASIPLSRNFKNSFNRNIQDEKVERR